MVMVRCISANRGREERKGCEQPIARGISSTVTQKLKKREEAVVERLLSFGLPFLSFQIFTRTERPN